MQNTTNQPQTFYTKPGMPAPAPQVSEQQPKMPENKKVKSNSKQIFAIAGLVLFLIVAVMGIMIAQRQVAAPDEDVRPVAPTAPESQPSASTFEQNNCVVTFDVPFPVVECVDKTMYDLQGKLIPAGGALARGQQYEYRVSASATYRSLGEVKVHDVIPEELEYVRPAVGSEKYITNDPSNGILTANFGILEDEEVTVGFIVEVPSTIEPTEITNTALVYEFPINSKQPEPPSHADECSVTHTILPIGSAECVEKEAYTNFEGTKIISGSEIEPGSEFVYKITVSAEQTTTGPVTILDELHQDLTFIVDPDNTTGLTYDAVTRAVSIDLGVLQTGQINIIEFKVQLSANPQSETFNNTAIVTTGDTKHVCELPLKVEKEYSCNSECTTNAQCLGAGDDHICYDTGSGKFCRLASNPINDSCLVATSTPTPTPPPTGPSTPGPTPAPGCNDICVSNADCSNINHICMTTSDGSNRCRLAQYPDSTTCTEPVATTTAQQPELPTELLQSGPESWLNWLKAGLVTLGIGTALFLLL